MTDFTFAHRDEGFDNHIDSSIRGYSNLLEDIIAMSRYFVENDTEVVDIGCSTGKVTEMMIEQNDFARQATYRGIEIATGFTKDLKERQISLKTKYPSTKVVFDTEEDVRLTAFYNCSLVTSIFTLQFMSKKDRAEVIRCIFSEKTISDNSQVQEMITFNYYDFKQKNFTAEDILTKEKTLRNMMKPNTVSEIEAMIYDAGFPVLQQFWRNHNFVGFIAIK
jgi:tRNA (cmo5U34)-methyltransferase